MRRKGVCRTVGPAKHAPWTGREASSAGSTLVSLSTAEGGTGGDIRRLPRSVLPFIASGMTHGPLHRGRRGSRVSEPGAMGGTRCGGTLDGVGRSGLRAEH